MTTPRRGVEKALAARLSSRHSQARLRQLTTAPITNTDFSSNSYLSLSLLPELRSSYLSLLESHASSLPLFGSGGSRLLDGNSLSAESLERRIAAFHRAPAGLLFNSGFDANVGFFSCVPQPGDVVIYDELIHASVHDGMRLGRAERRAFKHNCVEGLAGVLEELVCDKEVMDGKRAVFVAVEGVYSMDGDVAPLREIVDCIQRFLPKGNGHVVVDEAHSTGLFGEQGRGLVCELGLEGRIFARLHTFGKAMGSYGAIILCSEITREYLVNYARPLIYTTAMPFPCLAAIKVTYDFLASGGADAPRARLRELTAYAHDRLLSVSRLHRDMLSVDPALPRAPIIPLLTPLARSLAQNCQERGLTVRAIVAPTVPRGRERVRICLHAGNSRAQVDELAEAVGEWVRPPRGSESDGPMSTPRL